jgi:hypothetical protein
MFSSRLLSTLLLPVALALVAGGCGSSPSSPTVPGASSSGSSSGTSHAAVDAAVTCIREHGVPGYQDPVVTPDGAVYTDLRSFQDAPESARRAVQQACGALMTRAHLDPERLPPAPAELVAAGVKAARCARAHGLPKIPDPNSESAYTPGHGFGHDPSQVPGGKESTGFAQFRRECLTEINAEIKASTLASLGGHGS